MATAAEALRRRDLSPASAVVALRNYSNILLLVQPDGWETADLATVRGFAERQRFDIVVMPGVEPAETNRFSVIPLEPYSGLASSLLTLTEPRDVYRNSEFAIHPPTDDHPFFGHYFKWNQAGVVLDSLGRTWQPFGGAGYLVLIAFLLLAMVSAAVLIVGPLLIRRTGAWRGPGSVRWWTFGYFSLLGLGFLLVEIPIVQLYILLVGDPTTAFAVVLFAVLVASGLGSLASPRVPWRTGAAALAIAAAVYPLLIRTLTSLLLGAPTGLRIGAGLAAIAPLGFLMGIMFPRGLGHLERMAPALTPWAWGINGTFSVISAVLAALLALALGFTMVVWIGAIAYGGAALLAFAASRSLVAGERNEQHAAQVLSG